jgi:hypothetical protein
MHLHKKAFFNLLRLQAQKDTTLRVEPWQVEDYRELATQELLHRLHLLGLELSAENFLISAAGYDNPEELAHFLWTKEEHQDPAYLLILELWRRLVVEKQSLSIFCDELDHRITLYESDPIQHESSVENMLMRLKEILEENVDEGIEPKAAFASLTRYLAHNLETFLYEYISDCIEAKEIVNATELLEDFYPFVQSTSWFDLLRASLLAPSESHEANLVLKNILGKLKDHPDLDLLLEMASFLVSHGDPHLFHQTVKQAFDLLSTEEDFQELLLTVADYYSCLDMDKEESVVQAIFSKRKEKQPEASIERSDKDLHKFEAFLQETDWSKI